MEDHVSQYGIIGNPLKHSLSPLMHNAAFKALDVEAIYNLFPLEEHELDDFFANLHESTSPIFGFNVTVPYKEKVLKYLDTLSPLVEKVGAVNTVVINKERKLVGYNTDSPGFMIHLSELRVETSDKRIAVLGAGGSAKAILATLCMIPERPEYIKIYNRTAERSEKLLKELGSRINMDIVESVMSVDDLELRDTDLLINTTSMGLNEEDPCLIEEDLLHPDLFVYDLIYNPKETLLLRMAREQGARTSNGLGMLFYQGVLAFQHWAQVELDDEVKQIMREALEGGLQP